MSSKKKNPCLKKRARLLRRDDGIEQGVVGRTNEGVTVLLLFQEAHDLPCFFEFTLACEPADHVHVVLELQVVSKTEKQTCREKGSLHIPHYCSLYTMLFAVFHF